MAVGCTLLVNFGVLVGAVGVICCLLFAICVVSVVRCLLFDWFLYCWLFVVRCLVYVVSCLMSVGWCALSAARSLLLFESCCVMCDLLLFVVCCW